MAGDWIKMRIDLADDPAVIGIAAGLRISEDEVVGKLHRLWGWADKHTSTGFVPHITAKWIDGYLQKLGFAAHMSAVGWLGISDTGVTFPYFDRHNGKSAKSRAEGAERARMSRKKRDDSAKSVTRSSQETCDKSVTREEKRREELTALASTSHEQGVYPPDVGITVDPRTGEILGATA